MDRWSTGSVGVNWWKCDWKDEDKEKLKLVYMSENNEKCLPSFLYLLMGHILRIFIFFLKIFSLQSEESGTVSVLGTRECLAS